MKKYFNNKQLSIIALALLASFIAIVLSISCTIPSVTYAYNDATGDGEIYYAGVGIPRYETETFSYATKSAESYSINTSFPNYYNTDNTLQNTCANVAGANLIGFYDRYFENLIPNMVPGIGKTRYVYYAMTRDMEKKQAVIDDFYYRMQTNVNGEGCTQSQYKNGIISYVQDKGLSTTFNSVMTNGSLDLNKVKTQLQNGNPISLYLLGFAFTGITDDGSSVVYNKTIYDSNHIAIAYGYEKVDYFASNGSLLRSEIYLKVATGFNNVTGVYVVNNYGVLNDAESVNIQ